MFVHLRICAGGMRRKVSARYKRIEEKQKHKRNCGENFSNTSMYASTLTYRPYHLIPLVQVLIPVKADKKKI